MIGSICSVVKTSASFAFNRLRIPSRSQIIVGISAVALVGYGLSLFSRTSPTTSSVEVYHTRPQTQQRSKEEIRPIFKRNIRLLRNNFKKAHFLLNEMKKRTSFDFLHFQQINVANFEKIEKWMWSDLNNHVYNDLVKDIIKNKFDCKMVCVDRQQCPQGAMALSLNPSAIYVDRLVSAPENAFRGSSRMPGVGVALMIQAARIALIYGKKKITLVSLLGSLSFYEKLGFNCSEIDISQKFLSQEQFPQLLSKLPLRSKL